MYVAAVFSNGHVATGRHHGEAYARLSCEDRDADLVSGHVNPDGTFTTEMDHPHKDILIIRHAESQWNAKLTEDLDSDLTDEGERQRDAVARFIKDNIDYRSFMGFTSPFLRCLKTSNPLRKLGVRFFVENELAEITNEFPDCGVSVPCRRGEYSDFEWNYQYESMNFRKEPPEDFLQRLKSFMNRLPQYSIIVTHGSVVQTLTEMALGVPVDKIPAWDNSISNASITYIKDGTVIWLSKKCY